ncbi:hypothetical protein [Paenibacillus qinlingensis]|uniref:hypothetical protein n=1 Tax=Paenibacillus qinlingensis TaxID=1837343 RepID=UPI0015662BAF|nr:hypothetical protein [Paenibacillus qinlingensis]NQX63738.1 hypothetical protein [Paenibacillus qinlingensis]
MGLDVVMYGGQKERLGVIEISYPLHEAIYIKTNQWASKPLLRKLRDYYKTDITLERVDIKEFVFCLEQVKSFAHDELIFDELELLITSLSNPKVEQIHLAGD